MRAVVLISGGGSNLQSIIDQSQNINLSIEAVISNKANAYGLKRAKTVNIPTHVLEHGDFTTREDFDKALSKLIDQHNPELIILAGFMRILTTEFTEKYLGKILNIHPSLLPKFRGLDTHQRAIEAGEKEHGASIHFVTKELDGGPVIAQKEVEIFADDDAKSLADRVLVEEHKLYPRVISWFTSGRLKLKDNQAILDGQPL